MTQNKTNPEYVQVSVLNHKNLMPETLMSLPSMMASLGYSHVGTEEYGWTFEFLFDFHDPKAEPNDKEIMRWLHLRYFETEIERYTIPTKKENIFDYI